MKLNQILVMVALLIVTVMAAADNYTVLTGSYPDDSLVQVLSDQHGTEGSHVVSSPMERLIL